MNPYEPSFDDDRQFDLPGFLWDQFTGNQGNNNSPFPGQPGGQSPGFPGGPFPGQPGGQFPGQPGGPFPGQPGGQFPGQPGGQFPGPGGGQTGGVPTTPPPSFTPAQPQLQTFAVDPGAIRGCLFRFTYVWLKRDAFWFFPTFVGRNSVAGFRWSRNRWSYFGIDLNNIQSFQCF